MKFKLIDLKDKKQLLGVLVVGVILLALAAWLMSSLSVPYDTSDPEVREKLEQITEYRQQIAQDENVVNAYISIGKLYNELGDERRELGAYRALAKARPLSSPPFIAMGQYYIAREEFGLAERNILRAIRNNPDNAAIYQDLAFLYIYNLPGRDATFEALILDNSQQHPTVEPNLIHTLAFYFRETGNNTKAIEYFNRLVELVPEKASEWRAEIANLQG